MTDRMTEEKANKLSNGFILSPDTLLKDFEEHFLSKGYLQGLEAERKRVNGLVEAIERFLIGFDLGQFTIVYNEPRPEKGVVPMFKESLSQYRDMKGGEGK